MGGIHPPYYKEIGISEPLRVASLPHVAVVPLSQHIGAPNEAVVKKGDYVEEGQLIGKSSSYVSSPVHSPIYGKVLDIKKAFHPTLGPVFSVFIERDETKPVREYGKREIQHLSAKELIDQIKNAGLVGMGGAAFPTHVKLNIPEGKKIETLIINGAECEPYLICDHFLMMRKTREILKGIEILIKILQPKETFLMIEDNKRAAIFAFRRELNDITEGPLSRVKIVTLKAKYPQGGEKQLIKALSGKEVPPGGLPLDIGFLVHNAGTVYAIYEAVYLGKPLIERIITISGDCLKRPGNYLIRVGTTIKDIVEKCGIELYRSPKKIIVGGPMMGIAQPHMEAPVLKSTSGILFLSERCAKDFEEGPCIKCAKCVDVCPVRLLPTAIMKNVKHAFWSKAEELCISDCIECGSCSYICPARIPLIQYIKEGKRALAKHKKK